MDRFFSPQCKLLGNPTPFPVLHACTQTSLKSKQSSNSTLPNRGDAMNCVSGEQPAFVLGLGSYG